MILAAIREGDRLPAALAPAMLFDVVTACTRQPRPAFAGEALAAAQAAVRHQLFSQEVLAESLREIASMMREIAG